MTTEQQTADAIARELARPFHISQWDHIGLECPGCKLEADIILALSDYAGQQATDPHSADYRELARQLVQEHATTHGPIPQRGRLVDAIATVLQEQVEASYRACAQIAQDEHAVWETIGANTTDEVARRDYELCLSLLEKVQDDICRAAQQREASATVYGKAEGAGKSD